MRKLFRVEVWRRGHKEMKRTVIITTVLAILLISVSPTFGQRRSAISKKSAAKQTFAPRIEGHSSSFIIEGILVDARSNTIRIKTAKGERYSFEIDDQTTVLSAGELVSISTMAEIELTPSDLNVFDRVEIVAEREGLRQLARIVTRVQSERDQVAKR